MSKLTLYTAIAVTALALSVTAFAGTAGAWQVPQGGVTLDCKGVAFSWQHFGDESVPLHVRVTQGTTVIDKDVSTGGEPAGTVTVPLALTGDGLATALITWTAAEGGSTTVTKTLECAPPPTTTTTTPPVHDCRQLDTCEPVPPVLVPPVTVTQPDPAPVPVAAPAPPAVPAATLPVTGSPETDQAAVGLALIALGAALALQSRAEKRRRGLRLDPTEPTGGPS